MEYRFVSFRDTPDWAAQLARLSNVAFAEYEGAPEVDAAFVEWYLRRPGSGPSRCFGALWGDQLVASALVAMQSLNLGGESVRCGIIDTVATDPAHRQRGLARRLMDMAHAAIREQGGEAAVLYTNPEGHPYRFYGRLGYLARSRAALLTGSRPDGAGRWLVRPAAPADTGAIQALVNRTYEIHEGFATLDEALWDWHRVHRPPSMPLALVVAESAGEVVGTAAIAGMDVLLGGQRRRLGIVSDAVYPDRECLRELLAASPETDLAALYDTRAPQAADLRALGFAGQLGEVSMVLPLTDRAGELLGNEPAPWYVMVESVIGV